MDSSIHLSEDEWSEIDRAITRIEQLEPSLHYTLLERNFAQLGKTSQFASISLSLGRQFAKIDNRLIANSLMTTLVNWLLSMRLYLDHQEALLKRRFGRGSAELARFEAVTSNAYDSRIGYRFCYRLRNYVQHTGVPVGRIQASEPEGLGKGVQKIRFLIERDGLLADRDLWGATVKADLRAFAEWFEFMPLVHDAMEGLRAVADECIEIQIDEALSVAPLLENAIARIAAIGKDGEPTLFRFTMTSDRSSVSSITPHMISADAVRTLHEVASGSRTRDSIRVKREDDETFLSPERIRARFHQDSRGVQVLTAWLTGGGFDQGFADMVNEVLRQDGGPNAVITGLTEVSAVLASMSGSLLGTTADALITSLIEVYSPYGDDPSTVNWP